MKKIYLVAPSFGCTTNPYDLRLVEAIKNLKKDYEIIEGNNIYKALGKASSNTPELRGKEINDAFNSDSDIVLSVGGGELMLECLEYIDFNIIKNNPKTYVGFSDNTNLTYTITTILDIETIYGVNAPSFDTYPYEYDAKDTIKMLEGEKTFIGYKGYQYNDNDESPIHKYKLDSKTKVLAFNYQKTKGRIIGGCLDCLVSLCGTKFDNTVNYINMHKNEGIIFFMEACDLNSISLRRALLQLKYAGWFDNVDMFLIGRSNNYYDTSFNISMHESYLDILSSFNKPILLDAPISHLSPTLPIKCGAIVEVEYKNNNIIMKY